MILLTRPYEQSASLAHILGERNCIIAPMMQIEKCNFILPEQKQATISTSKNVDYETDINIPTHGKNAEEVLQYCLNNLSKNGGKIIYLSGDDVTLDIAEKLKNHGFDAERVIAYKQVPTQDAQIDLEQVSIATFFSLNSLKNFLKIFGNHDLSKISAICISNKVGKLAEKQSWKKIDIAEKPELKSMIDKIQKNTFY